MRVRTTLASTMILALGLTGCGGSEEEELAQDACEVLDGVADGGPEALLGAMESFQEIDRRASEADISQEEMDEAMREECPEVFEEIEGMFEQGVPDEDVPDADADAGDDADDE